jgi:phosphoribosyl-AMP cyclohydrolase
MNVLEEGTELALEFEKLRKIAERDAHVVPVVLQNAETGEVLYLAYANREALRETLVTRQAVLWSTSRNELWHKGATSGDVLDLVDVVVPRTGGVCHTRDGDGNARPTCYYRRVLSESEAEFL